MKTSTAFSFLGVVVGFIAIGFATFVAIWNWWAGLATLLGLTAAVFAFAWRSRKPRDVPAPPAREWHIWDDEYEIPVSTLRDNLRTAGAPWATNPTSPFLTRPAAVTDAQKDRNQ